MDRGGVRLQSYIRPLLWSTPGVRAKRDHSRTGSQSLQAFSCGTASLPALPRRRTDRSRHLLLSVSARTRLVSDLLVFCLVVVRYVIGFVARLSLDSRSGFSRRGEESSPACCSPQPRVGNPACAWAAAPALLTRPAPAIGSCRRSAVRASRPPTRCVPACWPVQRRPGWGGEAPGPSAPPTAAGASGVRTR
jgi:hypothetical protein